MIELYHNDMSTCSQKVRLALAEKGLEFASHTFNLRAGEHKNPDYLKLNPNGVVPTLVHDGTVVIESTVINEYLDDAFSGPPLRPAEPYARARMRLWTKQLDEGVHAAGGVLSFAIAFRHQILAMKGRAQAEAEIERIADPAKRAFQRENVLKGLESKFLPGAVRRYRKVLADMDAALAEAPWLAGADYSLADAGFTPYILRLEDLALAWMWDDRPRIADWLARIKARPNYAAGVAKWINPDAVALMNEHGAAARERIAALAAD